MTEGKPPLLFTLGSVEFHCNDCGFNNTTPMCRVNVAVLVLITVGLIVAGIVRLVQGSTDPEQAYYVMFGLAAIALLHLGRNWLQYGSKVRERRIEEFKRSREA